MAQESTQTIIRKGAVKSPTGSLTRRRNIGASFSDILDVDRDSATNISLDMFFDNVMAFFNEAPFIYYGRTEPTNSHVMIWVDTSTDNQANLS